MKIFRRHGKARKVLIAFTLVALGLVAYYGVYFYLWREGRLGKAYHMDEPLGRLGWDRAAVGAHFCDFSGGAFEFYSSGLNPTPSVWWLGEQDGVGVSISIRLGARDWVILIPLPGQNFIPSIESD